MDLQAADDSAVVLSGSYVVKQRQMSGYHVLRPHRYPHT